MTITKQRIVALLLATMMAAAGAFAASITLASDAYAVGAAIEVSPVMG